MEKDSKIIAGFAAAMLATIIWAGNFVAARALANQIPPCQFNFWRWFIAFLAILPFSLPHLKNDWPIARAHFRYLSLMALLGMTLMNVFIYKAGQTTSSLNMALTMSATPALIMVLARIFYGVPITFKRLLGLIACILGILILICRGSWKTFIELDFQNGDIWTLGGMICFAFYSLFIRNRPEKMSSAGFNAFLFALGIIYLLPLLFTELWLLPLPTFNWQIAVGILYSGIGCSSLAFWLWTIGIDNLGPVKAGFVYYSLPVFAAVMSRLILSEHILAAQIAGGVMIIGGICIATISHHAK